MMKFLLL